MFKKLILSTAVVSAGVLIAGSAHAKPPTFSGDKVYANPDGFVKNTTLSVKGPNGFHKKAYAANGKPSLTISENGKITDGVYTWQTKSMSSQKILNPKRQLNNGRSKNATKKYVNKPVAESGSFRVADGIIVKDDPTANEGK